MCDCVAKPKGVRQPHRAFMAFHEVTVCDGFHGLGAVAARRQCWRDRAGIAGAARSRRYSTSSDKLGQDRSSSQGDCVARDAIDEVSKEMASAQCRARHRLNCLAGIALRDHRPDGAVIFSLRFSRTASSAWRPSGRIPAASPPAAAGAPGGRGSAAWEPVSAPAFPARARHGPERRG